MLQDRERADLPDSQGLGGRKHDEQVNGLQTESSDSQVKALARIRYDRGESLQEVSKVVIVCETLQLRAHSRRVSV